MAETNVLETKQKDKEFSARRRKKKTFLYTSLAII